MFRTPPAKAVNDTKNRYGKRKSQHQGREIKVPAVPDEARRNREHQQGCANDANQSDHEQHGPEGPGHGLHEFPGLVVAVLLLVARHDGHEPGPKTRLPRKNGAAYWEFAGRR